MDDSITKIPRPGKRTRVSARPEAQSEYSRGSEAFRRLSRRHRRDESTPSDARPTGRASGTGAVVLVAAIGALLVLVAQFIPLYHVHVPTSSAPIKTVDTGANHGWAPVPIALVCFALAAAVYRHGNRAALFGLAVLGVATLLIALLGDLPDAHATGLIGSSANQYVQGVSSPSAGLYLETLGAVLLLVSGGVGFLMLGSAPSRMEPSAPGDGDPSALGDGDPPALGDGEPPAVGDGEPQALLESQEAGPKAPRLAKGPLSLRDSGRRKWSAS